MSKPHPHRAGTYGPELLEWVEGRHLHPKRSAGPRWWQELVVDRALEHDERGILCWPTVVLSGPRQIGKSWLERMVCAWRMSQAERWGEEQAILHTAHKLIAAQEVWRPAARWAVREGHNVRWANGEQNIELPDGSRWMIQAANDGAGVAFSLSMALVDEAWRVPRRVFDEAIEPTMAEAMSPQSWLVSTAGTSESDLMMTNRAAALAELDEPRGGSVLLIEWSAPPDPDLDIDDPTVWRAASPHWDERREERMRAARTKAEERAFRQQWLNQWVPTITTPMMDERVYDLAVTNYGPTGAVAFAIEVLPDRSAAVIVAAGESIVEFIEERPGTGWVLGRIAELIITNETSCVALDGLGPAASLAENLRDLLGDKLRVLTGRETAAASGLMYDRLTSNPPTVGLVHNPAMRAAVAAARQRRYGQTWTFSRDIVAGVSGAALLAGSIALLVSERPIIQTEMSQIW